MGKQRNVMVSEEHHQMLKDLSYQKDRYRSDIVREALDYYFSEFRPIESAPKDGRSILIKWTTSDGRKGFISLVSWNAHHKVWVCCRFAPGATGPVVSECSEETLKNSNAGWLPLPGDNVNE